MKYSGGFIPKNYFNSIAIYDVGWFQKKRQFLQV